MGIVHIGAGVWYSLDRRASWIGDGDTRSINADAPASTVACFAGATMLDHARSKATGALGANVANPPATHRILFQARLERPPGVRRIVRIPEHDRYFALSIRLRRADHERAKRRSGTPRVEQSNHFRLVSLAEKPGDNGSRH